MFGHMCCKLASMSELSGFVYIKSHVVLHVNSKAQKGRILVEALNICFSTIWVGHRLNNLVFTSIVFYFAHCHAEQAFLWRILVEQWFSGCAAEAFVPITRLGWEMYKKAASIFRPMIDWERETYERLSKTLRFTFWYSWMYLISNCIFFILHRNTSWERAYKEGGYHLNNFDDLLHSYGKRL